LSKGDKHTYVGQFFEETANSILGGDLTRNDDGDISLWRTETCVEVKSSGHQSSYGFRLSTEQIEMYERISKFPWSYSRYMLFAYRNGRVKDSKGKRVSELSAHDFPPAINNYLAKAILWCTVVDLSIVSRWKEVLPHSTKSVMGHRGLRTVDLKTQVIHSLSNGGFKEELRKLDLDPEAFTRISGHIKLRFQFDLFNEYDVSFPITAILPKEEAASFQRMLKRRGFTLSKVAA